MPTAVPAPGRNSSPLTTGPSQAQAIGGSHQLSAGTSHSAAGPSPHAVRRGQYCLHPVVSEGFTPGGAFGQVFPVAIMGIAVGTVAKEENLGRKMTNSRAEEQVCKNMFFPLGMAKFNKVLPIWQDCGVLSPCWSGDHCSLCTPQAWRVEEPLSLLH